MIRLNAGFSRKVGEANYGSRGASVNVDLELESNLIGDPDALAARIQDLFAIARRAVDDELNHTTNGHAPGDGSNSNRASPGNGNGKTPSRSAPPSGSNNGSKVRLATASQVRAIRSICDRQNVNADRLAHQRFGVNAVENLTLPEASTLIDELKATATGGRNGGR